MRIVHLVPLGVLACSQARPIDSAAYPLVGADSGAALDSGDDADTDPADDTGDEPLDPADVVFNELLAGDGDGGPDWIELYNRGESIADLTGWTLADDTASPWTVPDATQLRPGAYLLIYADNEEGTETDGLHAAFRLSKDGEALTLASQDGTTGSAVAYPELEDDEAYARTVDGVGEWTVVPGGGTPAAPNEG